jgi:hypothetical protein
MAMGRAHRIENVGIMKNAPRASCGFRATVGDET